MQTPVLHAFVDELTKIAVAKAHAGPRLRPRVEVIVRDEQGRVLLGKNPRHGSYQFPGGGIEGTSVDAAARREAAEEAGIKIMGVKSLGRRPDKMLDPKYKTGFDGWETHWRTARMGKIDTKKLGDDGDTMSGLRFYTPEEAIQRLRNQPGLKTRDKIAPQRIEILKSFMREGVS